MRRVWVEKTITKNQPNRSNGEYAFGKVLWSPQRDQRNADIYSSMRDVKQNDIILHLTNNEGFTGVSLAADKYHEGESAPGAKWQGAAYIIPLKGFKEIKLLRREDFLINRYKPQLDISRKNYKVFYNAKLELNQGAYLTECPLEVAALLNQIFIENNNESLPYVNELVKDIDVKKLTKNVKEEFDYKEFANSIAAANLKFTGSLILRFVSSLCTKPFVILTGLAGSGKTKLAQAFSQWITENDNQVCIVPVGADWTNREPLLGFPNALDAGKYVKPDNGVIDLLIEAGKEENADKPYFLILDEMNLSHVERYLADFLSTMESGKEIPLHSGANATDGVPSKIRISKNLFIIGTVNIDETTYMFSPKVLDRANVIEFRVSANEIADFLQNPVKVNLEKLNHAGSDMAASFIETATNPDLILPAAASINEVLLMFFVELQQAGAEFGYRSASEIYRLLAVINSFENSWDENQQIDVAVMQKLLPKLHGSRRKLEPVLKTLAGLCLQDPNEAEKVLSASELDSEAARFPVSLEKIYRMHKNAIKDGFTSFAEA